MKKRQWLKTLIAGIFLTTVLAVPLGIMAGVPPEPTLSFEGVSLNMMPDGSAQMLFTVYVEDVHYSDGARFELDYNPFYLEPSNHVDNQPLSRQGLVKTDAFFQCDPTLYKKNGVSENPFDTEAYKEKNYVDSGTNRISLSLFTKRTGLSEKDQTDKIQRLVYGEQAETYFVFDSSTEKVALGTLSFRVTNLEILPQLVERFSAVQGWKDPTITVDGKTDHLIWFSQSVVQSKYIWAIGACVGKGVAMRHMELDPTVTEAPEFEIYQAKPSFTFRFPETIIGVTAAEADLTLDAYRAYTNGNVGDVALAMQKYSPMVTALYADGSRRNFVMPWTGCTVTGTYSPTSGEYDIKKDFTYKKIVDGTETTVTFPVPVSAKLTVTPINLLSVTADELHKTYPLNDDLVGDKGVQTVAQLRLPAQARLVTDRPAGASSLTITVPGWTPVNADSKFPGMGERLNTLLADSSTAAKVIHWPTVDDVGKWTEIEDGTDTVADRRRGTYTFQMAETYGGAATDFKKAAIQAEYPWLTVPNDAYSLENATRRLVGESDSIAKERYLVEYSATKTDAYGHPELTLQVSRTAKGSNTLENMMSGTAVFRVRLPDGTELGTGLASTGTVGGTVNVDDWFADTATNHGSYQKNMVKVDESKVIDGYHLKTAPGKTGATSGVFAAERERLRRYINLGGWFAVAVNEDPDTLVWSDFIPVYVPPRANLHTADGVYNFVGANAGLFGWPGDLGLTVTLPQGNYLPVSDVGDPLYEGDGVTRVSARYGVRTTYDGATGAEPGELNTFRVEGNPSWTNPTVSGAIKTYGADLFQTGAQYGAYGTVENPDNKTATIRKEGDIPAPVATEKITLTYGGTTGVTIGGDRNVDMVTYDTRTQGYTVRQDYTLIITNVGTTDIYGLEIDNLTDVDGTGGHFVLLKPPASFLPAGSKTTFTLTYVYDLKARGGQAVDYRDKLFITSTSHRDVAGSDYLLDFDAEFQVGAEDVHKVLVKVDPANGCMGTARVIIGEVNKPAATPPYTMDITAGTTTFRKDDKVYIMVAPTDEYEMKDITAVDGSGAAIVLTPYTGGDGTMAGGAKLPDNVAVYTFPMPDYDATVTIKFFEPISSKLRLSALHAFADKTPDLLKPDTVTPAEYTIWQKSYSKKELADAEAWVAANKVEGEYLMTCGTATKKGLSALGTEKTVEQYLVVIPFEADYTQVEATLRQVVYTLDGANPDIKPTVSMSLYNTSPVAGAVTEEQILAPVEGNTATPTTHYSKAFLSPEPAKSKYVRVDISYKESSATETVTRSYYLEIHRKPKEVIAKLGYGNSPYGMIMNAPNIDGTVKDGDGLTAKDRAKTAFVKNGHTFQGLTEGVPKAVTDHQMTATRYWTEAWVDVNARYDPESDIGRANYDSKNNLDLKDEAFFATLNQDFLDAGLLSATDSSGRPADISKAVISLTAITLDTAQGTQLKRFEGPDPSDATAVAARTVKLELGKAGTLIAAGWEKGNALRPGLYQLVYTFPDYDATESLTVARPFVVLPEVGDVNVSAAVPAVPAVPAVDGADVSAVKSRVTAPLGYNAKWYPSAAIFKFRACDANNDRNINNIDANTIQAAVRATDPKALPAFYLPVDYKPAPPAPSP